MTAAVPPSTDADWVDRYRPLADRAFAVWYETGEWPSLDALQRDLDRNGAAIDVIQAAEQITRLTGEQRGVHPQSISLPIRLLANLPQAAPLMDAGMAIVKRAVELYFSDAEDMTIHHSDPALVGADRPQGVLKLAASLFGTEYPNPFGGAGSGPDSWTITLYPAQVRKFDGVTTLRDYLERQATLLAGMRPLPPLSDSKPPLYSAFVVMPFASVWSANVYEFIKRAAESLAPELDVLAYRADEITRPGKITDQIVEALRSADLIIADITDNNPNVMWELGFAQALGKPAVILNQSVGDAPFDLRDWRQIVYSASSTDTDVRKLLEHIRDALPPSA